MSLEAFANKIDDYSGIDESSSDLPYHTRRYYVVDNIDSKKLIKQYLAVCKKDALEMEKELTLFSVTTRDEHHKLWLEVAEELGLPVIETRSKHEGRYPCWMIFQQAKVVKNKPWYRFS